MSHARVGALRHRVTIEAENAAPDGAGGLTDPWANPTEVATVWAEITPLSGDERLRAMRLEDRVSHRIRMRYRADVTPAHRLRLGTRVFNMRAVTNDGERDRWLTILAEEGVGV